jgi:hypothetical protein
MHYHQDRRAQANILQRNSRGLGDALVALIDSDPRLESDDELRDRVLQLAQLRSVIDRLDAESLHQLDARQVTEIEDGLKATSWVASTVQVPKHVVGRRLDVAQTLRQHFPIIEEAWRAGTLNSDHVAAICLATKPRFVQRLIDVQDLLIELTDICYNFETWKTALDRIVRLADEDGGYDPNLDIDANHLRFTPQYNGTVKIDVQLSGVNAEVVMQAIEREAQALFDRFSADREVDGALPIPSAPVRRALGLVNIIRRANTAGDAPFKPLADFTTVTTMVELETARHADPGSIAHCDPVIHAIVTDSLGQPLAAGRTTRLATKAQRRALEVRDGGCVFPGCVAPQSHCEAHHVHHFEHGGATDLDNLASLCSHHHGVVHRKGWSMQVAASTGVFTFQTPTGRDVMSQRHGRRIKAPPEDDSSN